jgi:hypothetical protein
MGLSVVASYSGHRAVARHGARLGGVLCAAFALLVSAGAPAQTVTLNELAKKVESLEKQNAELQGKIRQLESGQNAQAARIERQAESVERAQPSAAGAAQASSGAGSAADTTLSSYGEISYSRPTKASQDAQVDVGRAVIGISHRFDEATRMVAEFEYEHAIVSADDRGEAEVEQLYVEREFKNGLRGKAGLYLMPAGLLNRTHEPTAYYGVFRNFVETAIIPTTWREAGVGVSGTTDAALSWDAGLTTGFNLTKWDPGSADGKESPLRAIHGEGQFALARDLSVHAALNWRGVPGLQLGGFVFTGKLGHQTTGFAANSSRLTLYDLHARYQIGRWDASALYARGSISNSEELNRSFIASSSSSSPTLVPARFHGAFVQLAYNLWQAQDYALYPFVRYERFNTAAGFGSLPASAAGAATSADERVWTTGLSFRVGQGVVLKADYQKFRTDSSRDRFNLGVGYSF